MIAGLLAVFFGWDANHGSKPRKWALAPSWSCVKMEPWPPMLTKNLVPNLEALMSFAGCCHVESIPGPTISPSFTISSQFFSIFHHSFRVFSHLSSSTICSWCPPIFMHFLAVFPGFSPPFIRNLPGWPLFFSTRGEVLRSSTAGRCAWPRGAAGCWTQGCCSCPSPGRSRRPVGCWAVLSSAERWRVVLTLTLFELENRHFSWK